MNLPPSTMRLRVMGNAHRKVRLWVPLFLLWPGLLVLGVLVLPLVVLLGLIAGGLPGARRWAATGWYLYTTLCALRGLNIEVNGRADQVLVSIK